MPRYILKAVPTRDLYAVWSTIVDDVIWFGPVADLLRDPECQALPDRMRRVEATGTSALDGYGGWADHGLLVRYGVPPPECEVSRWLPRENLAAYLDVHDDQGVLDSAAAERLTRDCEENRA